MSMTSGAAMRRGAKRYTIEYDVVNGDATRLRAVTPAGESMAVALATTRFLMLHPDARFSSVRIVMVEDEYEPDSEEDAVDYWNTA